MKPQEFYNKTASEYDRRHNNPTSGYIQSAEEAIINKYSSGRVLNLCCGTGIHQSDIGIDVSINMLNQAKAKGLKNLVLGNALNLPFPKKSFDTVICMSSILVAGDYARAFSEIYRVLKRDGIAIISLPSRWDYYEKRSFFKRLLFNDRHASKTFHVNDILMRIRLFSKKEFIGMLKGFRLEHFRGLFLFQRPYWGSYEKLTGWESFKLGLDRYLQLFNRAGYFYVAVFRKL